MSDSKTEVKTEPSPAMQRLKALQTQAEPSPESVQAQADQDAQKKQSEHQVILAKDENEKWADLLSDALAPAFDLFAPNWNVQPEEVKALSEAWGTVAYKHLGSVDVIGPEIMAGMMTVAVFAPRRKIPAKLPKAETPEGASNE